MPGFRREADFISHIYQRRLFHILETIVMALPLKSLIEWKKACPGELESKSL